LQVDESKLPLEEELEVLELDVVIQPPLEELLLVELPVPELDELLVLLEEELLVSRI
jgi:hypothetical protein